MNLAILTLRYDPELGGFDDTPLREFTSEHDVLDFHHQFFELAGVPHWAVLLRWQQQRVGPSARRASTATAERPDWRSSLTSDARGLFDALRSWRNARARKEGRPAYVILTNRQLAAIAEARPATEAELRGIEGIGEARARDYGHEIFATVESVPAGATAAAVSPPDASDHVEEAGGD